MSVISASKKIQVTQVIHKGKKVILDQVPCIYYLVQFQNNKKTTIWVLMNSDSEVNAMTPAYVKKLGLQTRKTDIKTQKIDGSSINAFGMVIASFQVLDK